VNWKVAQAKQKLSALIAAAQQEPQFLFNRQRAVALGLGGQDLEESLTWRKQRRPISLAEKFSELRALMSEENYDWPALERSDRPGPPGVEDEDVLG